MPQRITRALGRLSGFGTLADASTVLGTVDYSFDVFASNTVTQLIGQNRPPIEVQGRRRLLGFVHCSPDLRLVVGHTYKLALDDGREVLFVVDRADHHSGRYHGVSTPVAQSQFIPQRSRS